MKSSTGKKNTGRQSRRPRNAVTTKSGNSIKINHSLSDRAKARKAARAAEKAAYLATLPKDRWKRILYRLHPKRVVRYWFSRQGGLMALKLIGISIVVGFFLTIGLFAYLRKDLPDIKDISGDNLGGSVTYYDSTGQTVLWQDYNDVKRVGVQSNQIAPYMKEATVAIEDKGFYKEGAFDVRGIMRAAAADAFGSSGVVQGGSTITQQLVKLNENWTDNRTVTRKVKELILSVELERQYSKDDILTGYLNIAPYGGVDYGVQAAAEDYFQTSAQDLTLPEAAMLAAIPQSPSYYSPYGSTQFNSEADNTFSQDALLGRQQYILDQMAKQGYITQAQADAAKQVNVLALVHPLQSKYQNIQAPYFVLAAKQQLEQTFGATTVERGGWKVVTTLNMGLQAKAEQLVASNLRNVERAGGDEEATVLENVPTGQIEALVGGVDFNNPTYGQNNYAAGILIPPGSSFKPYDYTTLINDNNNVGAGSVLYDAKTPLPGYAGTCPLTPLQVSQCPPNTQEYLYDYDFKDPGPITLRYALGGSRNIPAAKAMLEAVPGAATPSPDGVITAGDIKSINKTISTASAMMDNTYDEQHNLNPYNCYSDEALTKTAPCYTSSAFGDGAYLNLDDHVNGLATIAREGVAIPRTFISKITDNAGHNVPLPVSKPVQVVKQDAAYIVDNMASDPRASYLPGSCTATNCTTIAQGGQKFQRDNGWDFAVKTGTTNNNFDGLMTAWSTQFAVVSWVGNHTRNVALGSTADENLTEPLTRGLMEAAHAGLKPVNWVQPSDIKTEPAFVVRNHIDYGDEEPSPTDDIYPSWYIGGGTTNGKTTSQTLDKVSGAVATTCTPTLAKEVVGNANVTSWNIDIFQNNGMPNLGSSASSVSSSTTNTTSTDSVHNCNDSPPTVTVTAPGTCTSSCTITATVTQGTHPLSGGSYTAAPAGTVTITLNGQTIGSAAIPVSSSNVYSYSFNYAPTSTGSGPLVATVVDSVLYQGTASSSLSYSTGGPITITSPSPGQTVGSSTNVNWSGGSGTFTVSVSGGGSGCSTSANNCSITLPNVGSYTIDVSDSDGDTSSSVQILRSS
jgi:membrane peptidoglycan carboxypeptidase